MKLFYHFIRWTVWLLFKLFYRNRLYRLAPIPKGAAIIAPNHASHLDPCLIGSTWPGEIHFLARDTLWDKRWLGWLISRLNTHPVNRESAGPASLKMIIGLLKEGDKVLIFPEGRRSDDGKLQPAQPGIAMFALRLNVPVIPVYCHGTYEIWPRHRSKPKLHGKMAMIIGAPIWPSEFADLPKKEAQAALTERLMQEIAALRDRYATKMTRTSTGKTPTRT